MLAAADRSPAEAAGISATPPDERVAIVLKNPPLPPGTLASADVPLQPASQATHIAIAATLENWDSDPQVDGLLLRLELLDAGGYPIAAAGTLQAELFAPLQRRFQDLPHGRGASVQPVGRWSETIGEQHFSRGAAVIRLPFAATRPVATDLASSYGLLHVRLAAPGHGIFEASYDGIRIRRFTPTRDLLERQDRRRVMFTEPPRREW